RAPGLCTTCRPERERGAWAAGRRETRAFMRPLGHQIPRKNQRTNAGRSRIVRDAQPRRVAFAIKPTPVTIAATPAASHRRLFMAFVDARTTARPAFRRCLWNLRSTSAIAPFTFGASSTLVTAQIVNGATIRLSIEWLSV